MLTFPRPGRGFVATRSQKSQTSSIILFRLFIEEIMIDTYELTLSKSLAQLGFGPGTFELEGGSTTTELLKLADKCQVHLCLINVYA